MHPCWTNVFLSLRSFLSGQQLRRNTPKTSRVCPRRCVDTMRWSKPLYRAVITPWTRSIYSLSVQRRHNGARCFGFKCKRREGGQTLCVLVYQHVYFLFCGGHTVHFFFWSCLLNGLRWEAEERLKGAGVTKENFTPFSLTKKFMFVFHQKRMRCVNRVICRCCNSVLEARGRPHLYSFLAKDCRRTKSELRVWKWLFLSWLLQPFKVNPWLVWNRMKINISKKRPAFQSYSPTKKFVGAGVKFFCTVSLVGHSLYCTQQQPESPQCHILPLVCSSLNYSKSNEKRLIRY